MTKNIIVKTIFVIVIIFILAEMLNYLALDLTLIVSLLGFILFAVVVFFEPIYGMGAIFFLIAFDNFIEKVEIPFPVFTVLGGCILAGYFCKSTIKKGLGIQFYRNLTPDELLILLYVVWIILLYPDVAWSDPQRNWVLTYGQLLALYFISGRWLRVEQFNIVAWGLILGATSSALAGLYSGPQVGGRLAGLLGNANDLGLYCLCALAMVPVLLDSSKRTWQKALVIVLGSMQPILVAFTGSRTGFLALLLLLTLWGVTWMRDFIKKRRLTVVLIGVLIIAAGAVLFMPENYGTQMREDITAGVWEGEGTMGIRYNLWECAVAAWLSEPIWGIGVGQFASTSRPEVVRSLEAKNVGRWVHDSYFTVLAENGLVGLSLFLSWQIIALRRFYRVWRGGHNTRSRNSALSCFSALAVLMFMALTMSIQYDKLLWSLAGFSIALGNEEEGFWIRVLGNSSST
jgi:O-antigen ligase